MCDTTRVCVWVDLCFCISELGFWISDFRFPISKFRRRCAVEHVLTFEHRNGYRLEGDLGRLQEDVERPTGLVQEVEVEL